MGEIWIPLPEGQKDDYMPIEEPTTWTLQFLIDTVERTHGRFGFELDMSGRIATIWYKNYKLGYSDTKIKVDNETGAAILSEQIKKQVVVQ